MLAIIDTMSAHSANLLMDDGNETKKSAVHNPLEQFVLLVKGTKGAACSDLIRTVLEVPGVYVFAELLSQPNVAEVRAARFSKVPLPL